MGVRPEGALACLLEADVVHVAEWSLEEEVDKEDQADDRVLVLDQILRVLSVTFSYFWNHSVPQLGRKNLRIALDLLQCRYQEPRQQCKPRNRAPA